MVITKTYIRFEVYFEWDGDAQDLQKTLERCVEGNAKLLARNTHGRFDGIESQVNLEVDGVYQD